MPSCSLAPGAGPGTMMTITMTRMMMRSRPGSNEQPLLSLPYLAPYPPRHVRANCVAPTSLQVADAAAGGQGGAGPSGLRALSGNPGQPQVSQAWGASCSAV